jgi:hypothetical protein
MACHLPLLERAVELVERALRAEVFLRPAD